ncbi:MAG: N-acetylmuramoyl-L-alanine amidase [Candidatus Eisenbacteria bacterium]|nr:N-acetylmuramoyl-L-alanine amidase [Candidatus Eisenbacteria bacterium]
MMTTPLYRWLGVFLLLTASPIAAAPPNGPVTLKTVRAPNDAWIAERRFREDAWRGWIVSADGTRAFDLGPLIHPINWNADGDTLHAVRLVDDGHALIEAGWVVVVNGAVIRVAGSGDSALGAWRLAYLAGQARTADVEERRSHPGPSNAAPMRVAVDPGHGGLGAGVWNGNNGDGAGSRGPNGLTEQWVNLRVAQFLIGDLVDDPRFAGSFLLRTSSTQQVSLADRVALASQGGADFYLSIHHNGLPTGASNRTETYYCRQNSSCGDELMPGAPLPPGDACQEMALKLHDRIVDAFGYTGRGAFEDSAGTGRFHFYVLRNTTMPAVLTEASNLNDLLEEGLFGSDPLERHAKAEAVALHLGLVDLAFGTTGLPDLNLPGIKPPVLVRATRRDAGGGLRLSIQSSLPGPHALSLFDPLGRRVAELAPFDGPSEASVSCCAGITFPVWLLVRHGGTIVAVRRLP